VIVDGVAPLSEIRLFVNVFSELLAILSRSGLLIAALVTSIVQDRFARVAPLSDVLRQVTFANSQPQNAEMYA
jgi:hypothetical protein